MCIPESCHSFVMTSICEVKIINMMRTMKVDSSIDLEALHARNGGRLHRGRPEMLVLPLSNRRNVQFFRGGTVQILGNIPDDMAEWMRREVLLLLPEKASVTPLQTRNIVVSAQLTKRPSLPLWSSDTVFYETELFPAALIRMWHPAHVAVFHNGKVIVTGLKTLSAFYNVMKSLLDFLPQN